MVKLDELMYQMTPKLLNLANDYYFSQAHENRLFRRYGLTSCFNWSFRKKSEVLQLAMSWLNHTLYRLDI